VEGFAERPDDRRWISISYVAPGYFETLGTPLLAGRGFGFDDQMRPNVAIVNRAFARYYFVGRNPIGKYVTLDHVTLTREPQTYEIVGVSADANYYEIREAPPRTVFLPAFRGESVRAQTFLIHTNIAPETIAGDARRTIRDVASGITIARIMTLTDQIDASIVPERLIAMLSGFFGALGAVLGGIGLYGLLAYSVARRTNEIGIRIALGATGSDVTWLVLRDSLVTVIAGLFLGLPMAVWGRTLAATLVQDLPVGGAVPFACATVGIIAVAFLASYVPHAVPLASIRWTLCDTNRRACPNLQSERYSRSGFLCAERGKAFRLSPHPLLRSGILPPLRYGQLSLDEAEHFRAQSKGQRRYAPMVKYALVAKVEIETGVYNSSQIVSLEIEEYEQLKQRLAELRGHLPKIVPMGEEDWDGVRIAYENLKLIVCGRPYNEKEARQAKESAE
jgi:hypothetical protein